MDEPDYTLEDLGRANYETWSERMPSRIHLEWEKLTEGERQAWCIAANRVQSIVKPSMCYRNCGRRAEINDGDNGMGEPVCCTCYESGLSPEPVV
jgi:hypothetical protein